MINRRHCIELALGAGAALTLNSRLLAAQQAVLQRAIPSTGEKLPVIGLGSSATFSQAARSEDVAGLRDVMKALVENGGKVLDKEGVKTLASIPSREVLLAQLLGVMQAPISGFARVIAAVAEKKGEAVAA